MRLPDLVVVTGTDGGTHGTGECSSCDMCLSLSGVLELVCLMVSSQMHLCYDGCVCIDFSDERKCRRLRL